MDVLSGRNPPSCRRGPSLRMRGRTKKQRLSRVLPSSAPRSWLAGSRVMLAIRCQIFTFRSPPSICLHQRSRLLYWKFRTRIIRWSAAESGEPTRYSHSRSYMTRPASSFHPPCAVHITFRTQHASTAFSVTMQPPFEHQLELLLRPNSPVHAHNPTCACRRRGWVARLSTNKGYSVQQADRQCLIRAFFISPRPTTATTVVHIQAGCA